MSSEVGARGALNIIIFQEKIPRTNSIQNKFKINSIKGKTFREVLLLARLLVISTMTQLKKHNYTEQNICLFF